MKYWQYGEEVDDSEELPGIEESDHSDEEEDAIITDDFVAQELQHEVAFAHVAKRLPCFAHTLQLVVLKFQENCNKPLLKQVHALVRKVNKSSKATEILLSLSKKKLVSNVPICWSLTFFMLDRLLELRSPLATHCFRTG